MRRGDVDLNASSLQLFMRSRVVDVTLMAIIVLNCVIMAISDPKKDDADQAAYVIGLSWFFNVIYCLEVILNLVAFGLVRYLMDPWHYIDVVVSAVSAIDIIVALISVISVAFGGPPITFSGGAASNLKLLRVVRVLRPLKAISFIPSLMVFIESMLQSGPQIASNMLLLIGIQLVFAAVGCAWIGDALSYRCIPQDYTNPSVLANPHYQAYGPSYFTSKYNLAYCGSSGL